MHMVLQNYCGNCGKRLSLNEEYCKGCGARTAFVDAGDDYMFTLPIYDIGFFDLDIDFSPYIESTRKDLKYEVCSCGYLNLKENYKAAARAGILHDLFLYDWRHSYKDLNGLHDF